jgi:hypothetical protein
MPKTKGTITIEMSNEGDFSVALQGLNEKEVIFALSFALHQANERVAHPTLDVKEKK